MSEPIWNQFLTERDKSVFAAAGYGTRQGFGKRPALLIMPQRPSRSHRTTNNQKAPTLTNRGLGTRNVKGERAVE